VSGQTVGRVLGTLDATPLQFWVAVQPGAYLQLDDVVVTVRELPDGRDPVTIAGVVTQVRARHEGATFDSDVFVSEDFDSEDFDSLLTDSDFPASALSPDAFEAPELARLSVL